MPMSEEKREQARRRMKAYWAEKRRMEALVSARSYRPPEPEKKEQAAETRERPDPGGYPALLKMQEQNIVMVHLSEDRAAALDLACRCGSKTREQVIWGLIDEEWDLG